MRRYALRMTLAVVAGAIVILGVPAMAVGSMLLWRLGESESVAREAIVRHIVLFDSGALAGMALMAAVGIRVAFHGADRLSEPLVFLAAAAEQLGEGRSRPRLRVSGFEEIDLVYEELRRAADRIAGRISAERQFASDASHQLRTPLTGLSMRLEEIQYLAEIPAVREEAGLALEQVERLARVVEDLLVQSRSAAGGATEVVRLGPIFDQQHSEWKRRFDAAGRRLVLEDRAGLPVLATPSSVAQILATLIENSLKYGEGTTRVSARSAGGAGVVVEVRDEGEGVPEDLAEAIFRKGVSTGGSTGYGLAIARQLADVDGGRLELSQAAPPVFALTLGAVPESLSPEKVMPAGSLMTMGARRRRR